MDVENSLESDSSSSFAGLICYFCDIFAFLVFQSCKMAGKVIKQEESLWLSVFLQRKYRTQFRELLLQANEFTGLLYCFVFVFLLLIDTSCLSLVS